MILNIGQIKISQLKIQNEIEAVEESLINLRLDGRII